MNEEERLEGLINAVDDEARLEGAHEEAESLFEWFLEWWKLPQHLRTDWLTYLKSGSVISQAQDPMDRLAGLVRADKAVMGS